MKKYHVNKNTRDIIVRGIPMIVNLENTAVIGLSPSGLELWKNIVDGTANDCSFEGNQELVKALLELNFVSHDEYHINQDCVIMSIVSAYVHVSNRCNLNCLGCYSLDEKRNKAEEPALNDLKIALRRLKDAGILSLVISGGEPFLRNDLYELLHYGKKELNIERIAVITNGTVKTDYGKYRGIVDEISVSVDGFSHEVPTFIRDKGIFDKIIETVGIIKRSGIPVSILPTLHKRNSAFVHKYRELANELGVELNFSILSVCDTPEFHDFIPKNEQLHELSKSLIELGSSIHDTPVGADLAAGISCGAANSIVSIATDGTVYPCHMLHESEFKMGNIFTADLNRYNLNKDVLTLFQKANVENIEECHSCEYKYFCSSGCRARAYFKTGTIFSKDSYCELSRYFYDLVSDRLLRGLESQPGGSNEK